MNRDPFSPLAYLLEDGLPSTGFGLTEADVRIDFNDLSQTLSAATRHLDVVPKLETEPGEDPIIISFNNNMKLTATFKNTGKGKIKFDLEGPEGSANACVRFLSSVLTTAKFEFEPDDIKLKTDGATISLPGERAKQDAAFSR